MKMLNKRIVFAVLTFGLMGTSQAVLAEMRDLTKDEIIAMFSGKTVWGKHARKDKRNMVYFAPDGSMKNKRLDERESYEGKWDVNEENRLCRENIDGNMKCFRVVDKNGKILLYKDLKHVWYFTKFKDGNCIEKC